MKRTPTAKKLAIEPCWECGRVLTEADIHACPEPLSIDGGPEVTMINVWCENKEGHEGGNPIYGGVGFSREEAIKIWNNECKGMRIAMKLFKDMESAECAGNGLIEP